MKSNPELARAQSQKKKMLRLVNEQGEEKIGVTVREDVPGSPHLIWPMTVSFWKFLRCTDTDDAKQRAERVARYLHWLDQAQEATAHGDLVRLKEIADEVRNSLGVVPSKIPKGGFPDVNSFAYPEPLSFEEIRRLLVDDIVRRQLCELFEAGQELRRRKLQ